MRAVLPTKNGHRRMPGLTLMVSLSLLANMETTVPMFLNEVIAHSLEVLRANVTNDHLVAIQAIRKRTRIYVKDSTGNRQSHNAILPVRASSLAHRAAEDNEPTARHLARYECYQNTIHC